MSSSKTSLVNNDSLIKGNRQPKALREIRDDDGRHVALDLFPRVLMQRKN